MFIKLYSCLINGLWSILLFVNSHITIYFQSKNYKFTIFINGGYYKVLPKCLSPTKKKESILADRATWDKLFWWKFFTAEATGLKLQLSHYPVSLLSRCMMRREFVWPPRGSTKGWIQSGAPRGQAGGGPSWGAPASHHLHTAARPVSLDMNPRPPSLPLPRRPPFSCSDKPHLHPSHILLPLLISAQSIWSVHHAA